MSFHPDDRPDPSEQPIRARVPEKVAGGCFSTGVIVMTAPTEFVLDFVQNLGRPHQIVARVVMPHNVLPQLVDALGRNIQLYRGRWGELPSPKMQGAVQVGPLFSPPAQGPPGAGPAAPMTQHPVSPSEPMGQPPVPEDQPHHPGPTGGGEHGLPASESDAPPRENPRTHYAEDHGHHDGPPPIPPQAHQHQSPPPQPEHGVRQASAQEIYDDLKIRDEFLSGVYANAVMIGHGPHEFSFDFITNFYPHSAVSARVFLAAGQIPRLHESLKGTWEQLRHRMNPPPPPPTPPPDNPPPPGWVV